ncbi:unnamed protein product, partial [Laminaria digitata]
PTLPWHRSPVYSASPPIARRSPRNTTDNQVEAGVGTGDVYDNASVDPAEGGGGGVRHLRASAPEFRVHNDDDYLWQQRQQSQLLEEERVGDMASTTTTSTPTPNPNSTPNPGSGTASAAGGSAIWGRLGPRANANSSDFLSKRNLHGRSYPDADAAIAAADDLGTTSGGGVGGGDGGGDDQQEWSHHHPAAVDIPESPPEEPTDEW